MPETLEEIAIVNPYNRIEEDEIKPQGPTLPAKYTDEAATKLVVQDAARAEQFLDQKQWNLHWREADVLYQAPRAVLDGGKARVSRFTVAKIMNSLVPSMKSGIFYDTPPFMIRPRPGQNQYTADAKKDLYGALLDGIDFEGECEDALESLCLQGTVICKGGWVTETRVHKQFIRSKPPVTVEMPFQGDQQVHTTESDEFEVVDVETTKNEPFFEKCELGSILVDPGWNKPNRIDKAKYVIHVTYPTFTDLDALRQQVVRDKKGRRVSGYDIPDERALKNYFFHNQMNAVVGSDVQQKQSNNAAIHHADAPNEVTTEDFLEQPIKMLERWDKHQVKTVLIMSDGRAVLIRNEEHALGRIPFFAANFWNIPNAGWGIGVGRLAGDDQRIEKGTIEAVLNLLAFIVNPQFVRDRGANAPTQQIRQRLGGIIDVDVPAGRKAVDAFGIVELPRIDPSLFAVLQEAGGNAQSVTGADEAFTQGNLPSKAGSSAARTATGAGGIMAANAGKIQGPVGHFVRGILLPFIKMLDEMVKERMPMSEIRTILGQELGEEFKLDADDFLNSDHKFEVLAGAHLVAKKAMAQILPVLIQILENPQIVPQLNALGYMADVKQLLHMVYEMSDWKNEREVIRPMNPQEQQSFAQNSPGAQKMQVAMGTIQAKHQAKSEEIDQQNEADLAKKMTVYPMEQAAQYEERRIDRQMMREGKFGGSSGTD